MFYLAIACYALVDGFDARYFAPHGLGFFEYITTSLFLNAWFPTAINSVVPGGWSVGVEFFFYLLFPTLVITITNFRKSAIAFAGTLAIGLLISYALSIFIPAPDLESVRLRRDFIFLWPGIQLPIFFVGFLLYFYILEYYEGIRSTPALLGTTRHNIGRGMVILSIIGIVALSLFHIPIINHILFSIIFAFLFMGLTLAPTKILINRIMDHLGTVSYSAYFLHFAVIRISKPIIIPHLPTNDEGFFIYFICVFAATMLVSTMTYHCIEKPGIEMGRRFASKIK
jgi:peptidoglycan/LPS O-acetylase OafA/YrhL